jgi:asparagine synthase (glutamine-hydrolysing)
MSTGFTLLHNRDGAGEVRLHRPRGQALCRGLVSVARHAETRTAAVLLGRLLYRDDLLGRLGRPAGPRDASDAELALAAYRRLGRGGLESLEGEFALVVHDAGRGRLLGLRDPFGAWPLFWSATPAGVAVGTSLDALVALRPGRSLNLDYLADYLMQPYHSAEVFGEQTVDRQVQRVPPGTVVEWTAAGHVERHPFWDWQERAQPGPNVALQEAGERFRSLLRQSVEQRLGAGPVAAHLSGGMDSSAVACLAHEALGRSGRPPLSTLSLVYRRAGLAGERAYIDLVVEQCRTLQTHYLPGDDLVDFDWFGQELPFHSEPYGGLRGLATERALAEAGQRAGAATTLTGLGSDEIADCQPYQLADLLRGGRWLAALREAGRWAAAWNEGLWSVLRPYGLEPIFPVLMSEGVGPALRHGFGRWPRLGWFTVPPWVCSDFSRRHDLPGRGRSFARRLYGQPAGLSVQRYMLATTVGDWGRWHLAGPRGCTISHPFRDPRLVCFTLGLPPQVRAVAGLAKPVLQEATRGVLPEPIRTRRGKRGFDELYGLGLTRNLSSLEQMVRGSSLGELGILDADRLLPVLAQAALGVGDVTACERLDRALALFAWFDRLTRGARPEHDFERQPLGPDRAAGGTSGLVRGTCATAL